jgi:hypothetical protein
MFPLLGVVVALSCAMATHGLKDQRLRSPPPAWLPGPPVVRFSGCPAMPSPKAFWDYIHLGSVGAARLSSRSCCAQLRSGYASADKTRALAPDASGADFRKRKLVGQLESSDCPGCRLPSRAPGRRCFLVSRVVVALSCALATDVLIGEGPRRWTMSQPNLAISAAMRTRSHVGLGPQKI